MYCLFSFYWGSRSRTRWKIFVRTGTSSHSSSPTPNHSVQSREETCPSWTLRKPLHKTFKVVICFNKTFLRYKEQYDVRQTKWLQNFWKSSWRGSRTWGRRTYHRCPTRCLVVQILYVVAFVSTVWRLRWLSLPKVHFRPYKVLTFKKTSDLVWRGELNLLSLCTKIDSWTLCPFPGLFRWVYLSRHRRPSRKRPSRPFVTSS